MAVERRTVDLSRWPDQALKAALRLLGVDAADCTEGEDLAARLARTPVRDVRTALCDLGVNMAGCLEGDDLLQRLLEASQAAPASAPPDGWQEPGQEEDEVVPAGSRVRLYGLRSSPALNMQQATVVRHDPEADRYEVRLHWDGSVKRVRIENLLVEEEAAINEDKCLADATEEVREAEGTRVNTFAADEEDEERQLGHRAADALEDEVVPRPEGTCQLSGAEAPQEPPMPGALELGAPAPAAMVGPGGAPADVAGQPSEVRRRKRKFKQGAGEDIADVCKASSVPAESPATLGRELCQDTVAPTRGADRSPGEARRPTRLRVGGYRGERQAEAQGGMVEGLRKLFWAGDLCDMTLVCGDTTFRAHKAVLGSQSEVFRGLLQETSEVRLADISHPEAVRLMLDFIYEVNDLSSYAPALHEINIDVLRLADKYQLPELKRRAAIFMAQGITTQNVVESLKLCEDLRLCGLRDRILEQLALNKKALAEISVSPVVIAYPHLLQDILKRLAAPAGS
eukprot:CAMPEP_0179060842 /NCGR_PEP_ID=MMETSP0796-20121207/26073_1 /TAXON_ID=73915 /ORGANISM="Pyrodinium bahamense, Strain pbaha01" /LENGTH=512 /DNA_ID=CAMNT_0020757635 /DNA_START=1 /DNA_END=1539 /DNA_ORIENTATION=+